MLVSSRRVCFRFLDEPTIYRQMYDLTDRNRHARPSLSNVDILLHDPWAPGPLNRLFRSKAFLEGLVDGNSIVRIAQRDLGLRCTEIARSSRVLYRRVTI